MRHSFSYLKRKQMLEYVGGHGHSNVTAHGSVSALCSWGIKGVGNDTSQYGRYPCKCCQVMLAIRWDEIVHFCRTLAKITTHHVVIMHVYVR